MQNTNNHNSLIKFITLITAVTAISFTNLATADEAENIELALLDSADKWQMNRLFEPTNKQAKKELNGQIMIYDGLRDTTVTKALDDNFDRIENMMFTRVVITDETGEPEVDELGNILVEDDGC